MNGLKNGCQFTLTLEQVAKLFDLPDTAIINGIWEDGDWDDERIRVFLYDEGLPPRGKSGLKELTPVIEVDQCGHHVLHFDGLK